MQSIRELATKIRDADVVVCRKVSSLVGKIKAAKTGFPLAIAKIRATEWSLLASTKKGSLDDAMYVTQQMREELAFWTTASEEVELPITESMAKHSVETDASDFVYGIMGVLFREGNDYEAHNLAELMVIQEVIARLRDQMKGSTGT